MGKPNFEFEQRTRWQSKSRNIKNNQKHSNTSNIQTIPKAVSEGLEDGTTLLEKKYMEDGKYEILPSFYKTLLWLKKNKR